MYCVLFGKNPASYYKVYREWYMRSHGHDVEISNLPFIRPSNKNFIYDPFSIDFDSPFDKFDYEEFIQTQSHDSKNLDNVFNFADQDPNVKKDGSFNFENFMKSIESLSYSAMYSDDNSKKFTFKPMTEQIKLNGNKNLGKVKMPDYPGQQSTASTIRERTYLKLAQASVLARKNELGLILDILSSCLDVDPKQRPTIQGLLNSPIF